MSSNLIGKFVAYGIGEKDQRGVIIDEGEKFYVIKGSSQFYIIAEYKNSVKIFDTEKERDQWISDQHYQYDSR